MPDSLLIAGAIELMGASPPVISGLPQCPGAGFSLDPDFDLGSPQPVVDIVQSLITDGERPFGTRASNRTMTLPVSITAPTRALLAAARETLLQLTDQQSWQLQYTRDDASEPVIFDCFRAEPSKPVYDQIADKQFHASITITFQALPYGRGAVAQQVSFASPFAGSTAPPAAVTIDDFSSVSQAHWTQASIPLAPNGALSAQWTKGGGSRYPQYVAGFGPADIQGLASFAFWAWFSTGQPNLSFETSVTFSVTLTDTMGGQLTLGYQRIVGQGWVRISIPIPQLPPSAGFDYTRVTVYSIRITSGPGQMAYPKAAISQVSAQPVSSLLIGSTRAAVYQLDGLAGTARALASWQFSQPPVSIAQTTSFTSGTGSWDPPPGIGSGTVDARAWGGGGGGQPGTVSAFGGGGGGAEWAEDPAFPVVPGVAVPYMVGSGASGATGGNGNASSFGSGAGAVTAHGGLGGAHGGSGGSGSGAPSSNPGGSGGIAPTTGGGGGAAGSPAGPGSAGSPGLLTGGGAGGTGVSGGGGGGQGAAAGVGGSGSNGSAPGGGGGGGGGGGSGGPGGDGAAGKVTVGWTVTQETFRTLIAHVPGEFADPSLNPYVDAGDGADVPDGTTSYPVRSLISGVNARFNSTYTVMLVAESFDSPSDSREVTVTVTQAEYPGGPAVSKSASRTVTPDTDITNGMVPLDEITLPISDIPPDNSQASFSISVTSGNTSDRFLDAMFLDTQGQTCWINLPSGGYLAYYLDEPTTDRDLGRVLGTAFDRTTAVSVLAESVPTGGPLILGPDSTTLLAYAVEGAPSLVASYYPRYFLDTP